MTEPRNPPASSPDDPPRTVPGKGFKRVGQDVETVLWEEPLTPNAKHNVVLTAALLVFLSLSGIGIIIFFAVSGGSEEETSTSAPVPERGTAEEYFAEPKYEAAVEAVRDGRREQALELLESLDARSAHVAEQQFMRGIVSYHLGEKDRALVEVQGTLKTAPDHVNALSLYGLLMHEQGRTEEVIPALEKCVRLNDKMVDAWYCLGAGYRKAGRNREAEAALQKTLSLNPGHAEAGWELALLNEAEGLTEEGLEILLGVVEASPKNATAQHMLSRYDCRMDRLDEGFEHAKKAVLMRKDNAEVVAWLAEVAMRREDWEFATAAANTALEISDGATEHIFLLAACFTGSGNLGEANWRLRAVLRREPEHYDALTMLGGNLSRQNRLVQGLDFLLEASAIEPERLEAWEHLARIYEELDDGANAEKARKKVALLKSGEDAG